MSRNSNAFEDYITAHLDPSAPLVRDEYSCSPLEILMAREDAEQGVEEDELTGSAWLVALILEFCFADQSPLTWELVARRVLVLVRHICPQMLVGRDFREFEDLADTVAQVRFSAADVVARLVAPAAAEQTRKLLEFCFASRGKGWLRKGVGNVYLLARGLHPQALMLSLTRGTRPMTFDDFATAFGEPAQGARARWSARSQKLFSVQGQQVRLWYQKPISACDAYSVSARGNQNRRQK